MERKRKFVSEWNRETCTIARHAAEIIERHGVIDGDGLKWAKISIRDLCERDAVDYEQHYWLYRGLFTQAQKRYNIRTRKRGGWEYSIGEEQLRKLHSDERRFADS